MTSPDPEDSVGGEPALRLAEAAERAGVHYNTMYRWVRAGRLTAHRVGGEWRVEPSDLASVTGDDAEPPSPGRRGAPAWDRHRLSLLGPLTSGDLEGAWSVVQATIRSGADAEAVMLDLVAPTLSEVGRRWAEGAATVEDEHRATAVAARVLGRLSSSFARPGRKRGTVVVGGAPGDQHAFASSLVCEILRGRSWRTVELGADVPVASWARSVAGVDELVAALVVVGAEQHGPAAADTTTAIRRTAPGTLVVVGGPGVPDHHVAAALGSDTFAADLRDLHTQLTEAATLRR